MRGAIPALCLMLTACSPDIGADIAPPPERLLTPCAAPQTWARGSALTQADVEILWGRDRTALRDCGERHGLLAEWAQGQMEAE